MFLNMDISSSFWKLVPIYGSGVLKYGSRALMYEASSVTAIKVVPWKFIFEND